MDPVRNPYAPGAGTPPPELAGRQPILDQGKIALQRIAVGRPEKSLILVGLRGVGKTVLLNSLHMRAEEIGYQTAFIEAHEGKSLPALLAPTLRTILHSLSWIETGKEAARRGLRVLKSFVESVSVSVGDVAFDISMNPERGVADSGDLEADLPALVRVVAEAARAADVPIAIFVDELQYLSNAEFSALIMAIHLTNQRQLPLILVGAGLPQIHGLAGNSKSYAERLFRFPEIGALDEADARTAVEQPAMAEGVIFRENALQKIIEQTQSYPYFLQQWAYEAWNLAENETIDDRIVNLAAIKAIEELDQSFFRVRFDRCTPAERRYMRALAELGEGRQRSGDIAEAIGVDVRSVAPTRNNLIKKGMIYSPAHGDTAFTVPMFHEYMRRVMPNWPDN